MSTVSHTANVMAHELAHAAGLQHGPGPLQDLMTPMYQPLLQHGVNMYINRTTLQDIQRWGVDDLDEVTRRELMRGDPWDALRVAADPLQQLLEVLFDEEIPRKEFFAMQSLGGAIGHLGSLARMDFS